MNSFLPWSGPLLVCGAIFLGLATVGAALQPGVSQGQPLSKGVAALLLLSAAFLLPSVPGMYAAQAEAAGTMGLAAYLLLEVGILLLVVVAATPLLFPMVTEPYSNNVVLFVLGIALTVGLLLTGVTTLRAGVFPTGAGVLLLAAMAAFFFTFFVAEFLPPVAGQIGNAALGVLLALGFAWIGVSLWMRS
jgi:hypothetical protein